MRCPDIYYYLIMDSMRKLLFLNYPQKIYKRDILDSSLVDQQQDQKYIDKLNRLDETIDDKKNNLVEKSVKDFLFNFNYEVPLT